jgi:hypothetical protein
MIVIGVAVLAIVTAVVIMVLPQDQKKAGRKIGTPPPAPERMDVNPATPKSSQLTPPGGDPWAQPDYPAAPSPQPMQPSPLAPDPNDPNDIFGGLNGGAMGTGGSAVMFAAFDKMCTKLKSCGDSDPSITTICDSMTSPRGQFAVPQSCTAAQKCLQAIDNYSCTNDAVNVMTAVYAIQDCSDAMTDC